MKPIYVNDELKKISGMVYDTENGCPSFTTDNIERVHNYVIKNSSYAIDKSDDFVAKYFKEHKGDVSLSTVITKIILIDATDSTNLKQLLGGNFYIDIAKRIIDSKIEDLIANGSPVGDKFKYIAAAPTNKSKSGYYNLFIFVSKYITRVNQYSYGRNDYSILDEVVRENLRLYSDVTKEDIVKMRNEYNYDEYCRVFSRMLEKLDKNNNNNKKVNRVMIDHFIWFSHKKPTAENKKV